MDEQKIAFIISADNEAYLQECIFYINRLWVPEGYTTDIIAVRGEKSIAAAYQEAMEISDAKFKIYLRQNTFLMYRYLLSSMVSLFRENPGIGILGVLGSSIFCGDGCCRESINMGRAIICDAARTYEAVFSEKKQRPEQAAVLDGMVLMTQYDVEWRWDIFSGSSYYDAAQCLEFRKKGYGCAVVPQMESWCLYEYLEGEDSWREEERRVFCAHFGEFGFGYSEPEAKEKGRYERIQKQKETIREIEVQIAAGQLGEVLQVLQNMQQNPVGNTTLCLLQNMGEIYQTETCRYGNSPFWETCRDLDFLLGQYRQTAFLLRRIEAGCGEKDYEELIRLLLNGEIREEAVFHIAGHCLREPFRSMEILQKKVWDCREREAEKQQHQREEGKGAKRQKKKKEKKGLWKRLGAICGILKQL